jgi:hypothetical protein
MKDRTNTSESNGGLFNGGAITEIAETAMKNYEQAFQTGMKLQMAATQTWSKLLSQSPQEWQERFSNCATMATGVMPAAQKRIDDAVKLMQMNGQAGAELMQKAMAAAQATAIADSQSKWMDFWSSCLTLARSNAGAIAQINAQAFDSWIAFVQQNGEISQNGGRHSA